MVLKTWDDFGIDTRGASGEIKTLCPKCSDGRKKSRYPCLNVNVEKGCWHCWHCDWSGSLGAGEDRRPIFTIKRTYKKPPLPPEILGERWRAWLKKRGISDAVVERNKLASQSIYMPQLEKEADAIVFPYFQAGEIVNAKYRDAAKNFRMAAGAERILYGIDDIGDTLIWVEGEMDRLSIETAGFLSCVSVPDGAPAPSSKNYGSKFDYIEAAAEVLARVKTHIIAVDADAPGQRLQEELIRRLGVEKCMVVKWPSGCKDANEVLVKFGAAGLAINISEAVPAPVDGIIEVSDVYDAISARYINGPRRGFSTGWGVVDQFYTVRPGEWTVVTGIPGHGKSEWVDALTVNLALDLDWRIAMCSPENQPIEEHIQKLQEKYIGKPFFGHGPVPRMTPEEVAESADWVQRHFTFILPEEPTLEGVLKLASIQVRRRGINGLVIDPWNEIEYTRDPGLSETEHVSKCLTRIRRFARQEQIHIWVVAHPTKMQRDKETKAYLPPSLYDISGSAHWRNKADNGITIFREVIGGGNKVDIHVGKIRFKVVGRPGLAHLYYDFTSGRYTE
jgi:twinkle protein